MGFGGVLAVWVWCGWLFGYGVYYLDWLVGVIVV